MLVRTVLLRYGRLVSFPLTVDKIDKAGFDVNYFLFALLNELSQCDDKDKPLVRKLVKEVEMVLGG